MADYIYRIVHRECVAFKISLRSGQGNLLAEGNKPTASEEMKNARIVRDVST
jgi:hypothetical protein